MKKIPVSEHSRFLSCAESIPFCRVFPLSVAEGRQSGSIYTNKNESLILIRHKSNFTFMSGKPDETELREIHDMIQSEELKFLCQDASLAKKLIQYGGTELVPRDIYSYPHEKAPEINLPDGFALRRIDEELFSRITGRVAPSVYWNDYKEYNKNGFGICVIHENEPASWAFSSAVSSDESDIGIETAEAYRHHGLALAAAAALIKDILPEKSPAWTCQRSNKASAHIAESLGFRKCGECLMIKKRLISRNVPTLPSI
ncbi:MAG: GNAT family N-acetyltransferase [Ruminococcus sp.]|uniref:GNAT family N-acetyltransferase n=1 Tax=Ruminococcus sp. TaxID=41978 RepID=UPI0025CC2C59|nr:GNAT family N-acetyltransferase [Ruminococcus sp.]MCR5601229.1 GNAT family N-acetyltransferase [Ruminococcus sp.]